MAPSAAVYRRRLSLEQPQHCRRGRTSPRGEDSGLSAAVLRGPRVSAASGLPWLNDGWNLTALAGLVMLYVLAWELHGHQRQQRWILPPAMRHPMLRVVDKCRRFWRRFAYVPAPKTSYKSFVPIGGAVLMLLSVPVFSRRPVRAVMAETLALLGVIAAGELLWLAPALVVIYAAWILDYQLGRVQTTFEAERGEIPLAFLAVLLPDSCGCRRGSHRGEAHRARAALPHGNVLIPLRPWRRSKRPEPRRRAWQLRRRAAKWERSALPKSALAQWLPNSGG